MTLSELFFAPRLAASLPDDLVGGRFLSAGFLASFYAAGVALALPAGAAAGFAAAGLGAYGFTGSS